MPAYGSGQYGGGFRQITQTTAPGSTAGVPATVSFVAPVGGVSAGVTIAGPTVVSVPGVWEAPAGTVTAGVNIVGLASVLKLGFDPVENPASPPPVVDGVDGGTLGTGAGGTDGPPPTNVDGVDGEPEAYDETDVGANTDAESEPTPAGAGGGGGVFGGTGLGDAEVIPVVWENHPAGVRLPSTYPTPKRLFPQRRVSLIMPATVVLDGKGRPVDWYPDSKVIEDWGVLKVYCGTTDVTTFRGVRTRIISYEFMEPFGYGPAEIQFPQISQYDSLGVGTLSWFKQGMNVTIKRLHPDGVTETNVWEGLAASWEPESDEDEAEFKVHCIGAMHQPTLEPMIPRFSKAPIDIGLAIADALNTQPARRFAALPNVTTGIPTRNRGSLDQSRFDYVLELLSTAYTADGNQWTIGCNPGRFPTLKLKNFVSQHWTVSLGTQGVHPRLKSDVTSSKNVVFGEGINDDGGRWRNSRYPLITGAPTIRPITWVSQNEPYTYSVDGIRTGRNPKFDPRRLRVATYQNYGIGVNFDEGVLSGRAELKRDVNPGWFGTIVMSTDPENGCKWDIRAGHNIGLRHHQGNPVRLFHIAHVECRPEANEVEITVDTNARDSITLAALAARNKAALADPAKRLNPPRRKSRFVPDERSAFDAEKGAGFLNSVAVTGGTWKVRRIPAGDYGSIVRTVFNASGAVKFAMGIFSKNVSTATLNSLVGNPLSKAHGGWDEKPDELSDAGLLVAWGSSNEAMGYYPSTQNDGGAITGRFRDDSTWDYISDDVPWLYVAIYAASSISISGRLYPAAED